MATTLDELKELLLQNLQETRSLKTKKETSPELKQESFPDNWEQPVVIFPDEKQPLGQVKTETNNDGNTGEVQHFTAEGTGPRRSDSES